MAKSSNDLNIMKEAAFLFAMDRIIGDIKIQNQFFGWLFEGSHKPFYHYLMNMPGRLTIRLIFPAAQGGTARQYLLAFHS
jgi:hypothetical protein